MNTEIRSRKSVRLVAGFLFSLCAMVELYGCADTPPADAIDFSVPPPVIAVFSATPSSVTVGTPTNIIWTWSYETPPSSYPSCTIDNGVGTMTTGGNSSVTLSSTTVFTLTCSNSSGSATKTTKIVANAAPVIASFSATPSAVVSGAQTTITWTWGYSNSPNPPPSCSIDNGVGTINSGGTSQVSLTTSRVYTLTCTNSGGSRTSTTTIAVGVPGQPSTITGSTAPCHGSSQGYSVINVAGVSYAWTFPAGWSQTEGGTTNSVTVAVGVGSGNVQVTPSNDCGNGTASTLAVVSTTVPAKPPIVAGSTSPCQGSSKSYSVSNVTDVTYTWSFPAGWAQTAGGTTNSVTVTVGAGSGDIQVTPANSCGNGTASTLAVAPTTAAPLQPSTVTGNTSPCQGSSQSYSVTNVAGVIYTWSFPAGWAQAGGGTSNSVTVTVGAGSGNIQVTPSNVCGNGTAQTLAVVPTAVPVQPSNILGSTSPGIGSSQNYSVTNVTGVTYTWSFPAGWTQTGGGTTNSVTVTVGASSGNVQVIPANGCGSGTARLLAVDPVEDPLINSGTFIMGSPVGELGRDTGETQHTVTLTRDFVMQSTEVTQGAFATRMGWNPAYFGPNGAGADCGVNCPVEMVSWYDAVAYANELSILEGYTPCYVLSGVTCVDNT
jgi:hypothetical protein